MSDNIRESANKAGWPLHTKILIGLVVGGVLGLAANLAVRAEVAEGLDETVNVAIQIAEPVGKVFLRLMLMVVVPLVFSALTLGVLELGDVRRLGRVGLRTLAMAGVLSVAAVSIGVGLVNVLQPGSGLSQEQQTALKERYQSAADDAVSKAHQAKSISQILLDLIPENPLQEMVGALDGSSKGNGMLAVMCFSLIIGIALSVTPGRTATLVSVLEGVFDVTMTVISFAMRIAPVGVACLVFALVARLGLEVLGILFWFVVTVLLGLTLQLVVVYPLVLRFVGQRKPLEFFRGINEAMLTAFGTSSSNATLPTALKVSQENLGISKEVSQFVLTVGATGNQNGTALYEGVVVLFLAQVFGVELSLGQQIAVMLMSVLAGIGTAGVPGGSLPLIVVVLNYVNVPGEAIGIILGVDRLLDMCRTVLNVTGDIAIAACVSRWEDAPENTTRTLAAQEL
jgi:DAACS family dicarboxylate/amino acid:cation (Na+ or H+) symporter